MKLSYFVYKNLDYHINYFVVLQLEALEAEKKYDYSIGEIIFVLIFVSTVSLFLTRELYEISSFSAWFIHN